MPDGAGLEASLAASGIALRSARPVAGGDIAQAFRVETDSGPVFLKVLPAAESGILEAERDGLAALAATATVRTPAVLASGATGDEAWLALEWLTLRGLSAGSERELGRGLAKLHRTTSDRHGWHCDNFIGRTPQPNARQAGWPAFFRDSRLGFQLRLAADAGHTGRLQDRGNALLEAIPEFFVTYQPAPSLLHGDLWAGNAAAVGETPVIFDPATHYGDRETDIAMTRLFGGFGRAFYSAYESEVPLDAGYPEREPLYQLYHVLNHLNLFGLAYSNRAEGLIDHLLSRIERHPTGKT